MDKKNNLSQGLHKDLTGKRFGRLVVLEKTEKRLSRSVLWRCQCDCGNLCEKTTSALNGGSARSCGCAFQPAVRVGDRFGRLTAVRPTDARRGKAVVWECRCDCGNSITARSTMLTCGNTTSCGCLKKALDETRDFKDILTYTDNTCIELAQNISKRRSTTSAETGIRGVVLRKGKYVAQITFQKKYHYLGSYSRLEDAVEVRRKAEARIAEYVEEYLSGNPSPHPIDFKIY